VSVDLNLVPEKKLEALENIPYGSGAGQVGIFIPQRNEEKPFGVNAVTGDGTRLILLDNLNRRVLSLDLRTKTLKKEISLPSGTFHSLFLSGENLFLYDGKEERMYVRTGDTVKLSITPRTEKTTAYPYTKFLGNGAVRVVLSDKKFFEIAFADKSLMSFLLVGRSDNGTLFFQVESGDGSRHILITSGTGAVLGKMKLTNSPLYKPETDIYVAGDGTVYLIVPDKDALVVYWGRP